MIYDTTAGTVETPGGIGKFVEYDSAKGAVTVEIGHRCLVCFPADECYVKVPLDPPEKKIAAYCQGCEFEIWEGVS